MPLYSHVLTYDLMKMDYFCLLDNKVDADADFDLQFDVEADLNRTMSEKRKA